MALLSFTVTNEVTSDSLIITISGSILGSMCIVIVLITTTFIVVLVIVIRSNRALRQQLNALKGNSDQPPVIYEEIPRLPESSTLSIETEVNTAYMSTVAIGAAV